MIVSVNWLKKFTEIDVTIDELTTLIGARLVEIDDVIDLGKKYDGVIVAKVVKCSALENSDHLSVTKIDDGGVAEGVERDENGYVQVVCGAPNVRAGILVAWLPPNSTVPASYNDKEPFVLGARKLRGVMSNGMLASAKELDLFEEHGGILVIDKDAAPGSNFAEVYELNDYLLDIENKSLTHRPDCFGIIGFAREVSAIQGKPFKTPDWLLGTAPQFIDMSGDVATPKVTIDTPELSARYQAVILSGADGSRQSPLEIQTYLARVGVRPISAVVDATNYLMMLTGQPLHAFDYDKLLALNNGDVDIHVRAGRSDETLKLLDGRTLELNENDIVIANGNTAVALAGAMGGADTEIDDTTKNIILESATFNLYNLRNTQMRHGIFSEAITRFTKGQPAGLTAPVLANAARLMGEWSGARRVSEVVDARSEPASANVLTITAELVNSTLGSKFTLADIVDTLQNVEFTVGVNDDATTIAVQAPYFRADIHITEDIIEEVGRLNGFDTIEPTLPERNFTAVSPDEFDWLRAKIRQVLVRAGANEVLTYSFLHGDILEKAGQKPQDSYRITNSISPDLQYYRQTLTPSLLTLVHPNIKNGYDSFGLFELNKTHNKIHGLNEENVPGELNFLAFTVASKKSNLGTAYYEAKAQLDYLGKSLGLNFSYAPIETELGYPVTAPFEYRRSALVTDVKSGEFIGIVGEYKKSIIRNFKLPNYVAGFEIGPEALLKAMAKRDTNYTPLSRYPSIERDVCFQVNNGISYAQIISATKAALADSVFEISVLPVDIYQPAEGRTKNITIRIKLTANDRTLTSDEATATISGVESAVATETSAVVI